MFDNVITVLLALDCHFDQGSRLSYVGTEGRERHAVDLDLRDLSGDRRKLKAAGLEPLR
jgi:hypothetical protein